MIKERHIAETLELLAVGFLSSGNNIANQDSIVYHFTENEEYKEVILLQQSTHNNYEYFCFVEEEDIEDVHNLQQMHKPDDLDYI